MNISIIYITIFVISGKPNFVTDNKFDTSLNTNDGDTIYIGFNQIQDGGQPNNLVVYVSSESRKRTGELNRQRMLGSKLTEETKAKMSKTRLGKHPIRKNDTMTIDEATQVKKMLIDGCSNKEIIDTVGVPYKAINSIISNNNYNAVKVDGWDEYILNRLNNVKHRLTKEQILELVEYSKNGMSVEELSKKYNIGECSVKRHIRLNK